MSSNNSAFYLLSINHENVPLEEREAYSISDDKLGQLYAKLKASAQFEETMVLSTCNRFELYARSKTEADAQRLTQILSELNDIEQSKVEAHSIVQTGEDAIAHLIEVAAGLRSQITGEAEIFGQVKAAYAQSQSQGGAGKVINRIAQKGFQAAKQIRHSTAIGQGQINISNVAVDLSLKIFGDLANASVLVLGTGEIGEKTAKALRSRGAKRFGVASRSMERATEFAASWDATPHDAGNLSSYISEYSIVIASIGVKEAIVTKELVQSLKPDHRDTPLFLIDLGLPRNIDPSCDDYDNVFVYNLDDLAKIAEENLAERRKSLIDSREIAKQKSCAIWQNLVKRDLVRAAPHSNSVAENPSPIHHTLMSIFTQLFGADSHEDDGWTQPQREALIDMLSLAMYADSHLSLSEQKAVDVQVEKMYWDATQSVDAFSNASITRARDARSNEGYKAEYLKEIAGKLGDSKGKAYEICQSVLAADGKVESEKEMLEEVRSVFGI